MTAVSSSSFSYSIRRAASMAGGFVYLDGKKKCLPRMVTSVSIDSRTCGAGSLFVALKGEHCDGHDYVATAMRRGAAAVLVDTSHLPQVRHDLDGSQVGILVVEDTLKGLQSFAAAHVATFPLVTKVGVTGSCGKTTTKELVGSILSCMGETVRTPGNLNSEIGLPLSVLQVGPRTEYGVFEMGVDHIGEMDTMLGVWKPDYGILTNIGISHVGKMGDVENIAREKSKIFHQGLKRGFIAENCGWRPWIDALRNCTLQQFGPTTTYGFEGAEELGLDGWSISYAGLRMHLKCVGRHSLLDALAAIGVAREIGATAGQIKDGIEKMEPIAGRSKVLSGDVTIIEDCYNASVDSTGNILDYLGSVRWRGGKKVVLGSMKELGEQSEPAHEAIGRKVLSVNPQSTFLYGREMESAWNLLRRSGYGRTLFFTDDYQELETAVQKDTHKGDLFLLKGSRAMAMERLVPAIRSVG
ncbi:MAG: UDP-N-acetylmuramoyl-tripeptide--D-alanyl-D-alanine ligase [Sphaerochaetaceae bacterium]|nr:UDP-N-acetylmuramoyl-tripeptide--D-alanyl-D-alanine ligase [Sphaerochaetaceae bacterium]